MRFKVVDSTELIAENRKTHRRHLEHFRTLNLWKGVSSSRWWPCHSFGLSLPRRVKSSKYFEKLSLEVECTRVRGSTPTHNHTSTR